MQSACPENCATCPGTAVGYCYRTTAGGAAANITAVQSQDRDERRFQTPISLSAFVIHLSRGFIIQQSTKISICVRKEGYISPKRRCVWVLVCSSPGVSLSFISFPRIYPQVVPRAAALKTSSSSLRDQKRSHIPLLLPKSSFVQCEGAAPSSRGSRRDPTRYRHSRTAGRRAENNSMRYPGFPTSLLSDGPQVFRACCSLSAVVHRPPLVSMKVTD